VFHVTVARALIAASTAGKGAGLELRAQHRRVRVRGPREQPSRHIAHIRTVEIEPNALAEAGVSLSDTCVGARCADLHTLKTCAHAFGSEVAFGAHRPRVCPEHLLDRAHLVSFLGGTRSPKS